MSKIMISKSGIRSVGRSFSRGALYELFSNPICIGEIRHKKTRHPGQHEPILQRELWERVRDAAVRGPKPRTEAPASPLAGKLFDEEGEPLYAQGAARGGRRYRYYVSRKLFRGSAAERDGGWRLAGPELERSPAVAMRLMLTDVRNRLSVGQAAVPVAEPAEGESHVKNAPGRGQGSRPCAPP